MNLPHPVKGISSLLCLEYNIIEKVIMEYNIMKHERVELCNNYFVALTKYLMHYKINSKLFLI